MNTAIRQEIHGIIDDIPERNLLVLRPLLDFLIDADDSLSVEEQGLLKQCREDRKERPETLTPWETVKAGKK